MPCNKLLRYSKIILSRNNTLKILTLCSWYPNETNPTLGNFVQKHADTIALNNETVALSIFPSEKEKTVRLVETKRDALHEVVVYYPKQVSGFSFLRRVKNFLAHRSAFRQGYRRVQEILGKPDIVHLNIVYPLGIWAFWLKVRHAIPYVVTENSSGFHVDSAHAYPKPIMKLCALILKNASVLMPVSENLKGSLEKISGGKRYEIICNVVNEKLFKTALPRSANPSRLIHISTGVDSIKNLSGMIRVANRLSEKGFAIHLDIVSDGDIEYAKKLNKALGGSEVVAFHATKTTAEIAAMLAKSDALLMFSNYENFPCVIAESMMSGKPVISSNVNGIPEHVLPNFGLLVNPGDEEALFEKTASFINGDIKFDAEHIRAYALENFGYESVGRKFNEVYRSIL